MQNDVRRHKRLFITYIKRSNATICSAEFYKNIKL